MFLPPKLRSLAISLLLIGPLLLVYWPVIHYEFVNFDDLGYVLQNRRVQTGLNWQTIQWALTSFYAGNWHPLTWLSHALDCQLFGLDAGGHHLTSVVLHALNTVLLFWVMLEVTGVPSGKSQGTEPKSGSTFWCCAFVAGLFGLHPMHVES